MIKETSNTLTIIVFSLFALTLHSNVGAQNTLSVTGNASLHGMAHSGDLPPLWNTALQQGRWDNTGGNQMLTTARAGIEWSIANHLSVTSLAEVDHATGTDETYLHTGWLGVNWRSLTLTGGKHLFDPVFTNSNSSSGSYLYGNNYRPVKRITLEMPAYTKVPFTRERIEVRGGISQGWLTDQHPNGDVLLHEKYAYMRWDGGKWKPYAGLNHSSLFGGQRSNGTDIPVDFLPTFLGKGSDKIGGGDATNAAGAHMGLYDFGTYINTGQGPFQVYYQIPFSDGSGMLFWHGNTDHVLGINWEPINVKWLSNLTLEWIQTTYQSGNGMPDPYMEGSIIFPKQVEDRNAFIFENFGIEVDEPLSVEAFKDILAEELNQGNDFGGRDGYMNNGMYPAGWARNNHIMGSPFNLTREQLLASHPEMTFNHGVNIKNDRFHALHAGARGNITSHLTWDTKITYTRNFGTYFEQYPGRYTWDEDEDYWFKGGRNQWYTMLDLTWKPRAAGNLRVNFGIAFDTGEIYQSASLKTGIIYRLF